MKYKNNWYPESGMKAGEKELKFSSHIIHMNIEKPKLVTKNRNIEEEK